MDDQGEFSQFIDGLEVGWRPLLRGNKKTVKKHRFDG